MVLSLYLIALLRPIEFHELGCVSSVVNLKMGERPTSRIQHYYQENGPCQSNNNIIKVVTYNCLQLPKSIWQTSLSNLVCLYPSLTIIFNFSCFWWFQCCFHCLSECLTSSAAFTHQMWPKHFHKYKGFFFLPYLDTLCYSHIIMLITIFF